jgi:hypothetical protein
MADAGSGRATSSQHMPPDSHRPQRSAGGGWLLCSVRELLLSGRQPDKSRSQRAMATVLCALAPMA